MAKTTVPGRLHIDAAGRLQGPADITFNVPWPTPNCTANGFGTAFGGVYHTEVGWEHSVIAEFNSPAAQASAFFSISMTGAIHQYVPLGLNYAAWTQAAGNHSYRGVEHEDGGDPSRPLTPAQLAASAQVFEAMSAYDGWPLEATDNPDGGRGIIFHSDGKAAWGGHDCPGDVRRAQRPALIALAKAIREGNVPSGPVAVTSDGTLSLADLCHSHGHGATPAMVLRLTAQHGGYPGDVAHWLNEVFEGTRDAQATVPAGLELYLPA